MFLLIGLDKYQSMYIIIVNRCSSFHLIGCSLVSQYSISLCSNSSLSFLMLNVHSYDMALFQGDIAGWQGDGSNVGFPHLNFSSADGTNQQNAPGVSISSLLLYLPAGVGLERLGTRCDFPAFHAIFIFSYPIM